MLPKLVLTDIDGVWTDGGIYYDNMGNEFKKFNTSDSAGVLFLKQLKIPIGIISGEENNIIRRRAEKLQIDYLFLGVKEKLEVASKLCLQLNISLSEVAYIGDDLGDISLLKCSGISAAPSNAPDYIKEIVDYQLFSKGGDGAFREFVEKILLTNNLLFIVLEKYK